MMTVNILNEAGYEQALFGLSLSYKAAIERMPERAAKLAWKQDGHNKFLQFIYVWMDVTAPRFWWQQADTYQFRHDLFSSMGTKQSESTMHTLMSRRLTQEDFVEPIEIEILAMLNSGIEAKNFRWVKRHLPEGFLQRRAWCMNYATLQRLFIQRGTHRLADWQWFLQSVLSQVQHPEFLDAPANEVIAAMDNS